MHSVLQDILKSKYEDVSCEILEYLFDYFLSVNKEYLDVSDLYFKISSLDYHLNVLDELEIISWDKTNNTVKLYDFDVIFNFSEYLMFIFLLNHIKANIQIRDFRLFIKLAFNNEDRFDTLISILIEVYYNDSNRYRNKLNKMVEKFISIFN